MKIKNYNYSSVEDLDKHLDLKNIDVKKTFIQVFSGLINKNEIEKLCKTIKSKKEDVKFIGTTTAGEIINGKTAQRSITISVMEFENTSFENKYFNNENNFDLGVNIAKSLFKDDTKVMILFIEGLLNNGNDVLDGISSINKTIPVSGGMAGDNGAFTKTFVFDNNGVYENGAVAVTLNSDILNVLTNYQLNWQPIGKSMTITKAVKNRLYEIDGIPASDIYRKYLGDRIGDDLPHSAIEFPLLKIEDDGLEVCRTFVHKFDEDGSLLTIGNLEVGDKVRLAFGNVDLILNGVNTDIQNYESFQPEAIFTYSCTARITFLQSDVVRELNPLNDIAPISGFFTYGEIYHHNNKNSLLNISLTILGLSEDTSGKKISFKKEKLLEEKNFITGKHYMVLDALSHLSNTVIEELDEQKVLFQNLFDAAPDAIVLFDSVGKFVDSNEAALSVFGLNSKEELLSLRPDKLSPEFQPNGQTSFENMNENIKLAIKKGRNRFEWLHIRPLNNETFYADVVLAPFMFKESALIYAIVRDISERKDAEEKLQKAKLEIEAIHKHTRDSIEYASLIQHAIVPDEEVFNSYFKDYFTIWDPKDIVGGDIFLFEELRNEDECLIMVIDCTGHGVPGAFVTMLVKAIERQISSIIAASNDTQVSTSWILSYFNKNMKKLLKQESNDSESNAGFDGGIIYYNKKEKIVKFSGAETALFYIDENKKLQTIKGDRHSIGYKKSDADFEFKEHTIDVKDGMKFYCTTDGFLDQNGGEKDFCMGKTKFKNIINENNDKLFKTQKNIFLDKLNEYQGTQDRNDDVTVVAFKI